MCLFLLLLLPFLVRHNDYFLQVFTHALLLATLALAWNILGLSGSISLGHAAFFGSGAYASSLLSLELGLSLWFTIPLAGLITAGEPIEAVEEKETMAVPANLIVDGANSYVLKVKGRSMIEDGILDGDYVIIERNPSPRNGDVVVALLDNAYATLKRFYREPARIRLQPANSNMKPIYVKDVIVQGVVKAVIRKFETI